MILKKLRDRKTDMTTLSNTLSEAMAIAQRTGATNAGAEHLLLAALAMDDGTARESFDQLGIDPDGFARAVETTHASALPSLEMPEPVEEAPADGPSPMKNVDATFEAAIKATHYFHNLPDNGGRLCGAYFVAGIASIEHGVAARALAEMGVDADALIAAATATARR